MERFALNFIDALILKISNLGLLHILFSHIFIRVMALDLRQKFVSAHYHENNLTDFHQILYMHSY